MSKSIDMKVLVIDINSGKKLFERSYDKSDDPRLITNAFLTKDKKVVLLGEYFDSGDNIMTSKSLGLFSQTLDYEGKKLSDSKVDWENQIDAMMPPDSEGKKRARGYVYFMIFRKQIRVIIVLANVIEKQQVREVLLLRY
ncbi:hypothetical protein Q2T40_05615 [Winogradskyella maritima]|nr:hypothetical protein [Winogradskyella maritima]